MSKWLDKAKEDKREWDRHRDLEHCYAKVLRENISATIDIAKLIIERKTRYRLEVKSSFSSIEVFVRHPDWKNDKRADLHLRLKACHTGIFFMYGARVKLLADTPAPNRKVLYSEPQRIDQRVKRSTIVKWTAKAARLSVQSLRFTEYAVEDEMKNNCSSLETILQWQITGCCLFRRLLRFLRFQ